MASLRSELNYSSKELRAKAQTVLYIHGFIVLILIAGGVMIPFTSSYSLLHLYTLLLMGIIIVQMSNDECPLTTREKLLREGARQNVYEGSCLLHYGRRFIPKLKQWHISSGYGGIVIILVFKWIHIFMR